MLVSKSLSGNRSNELAGLVKSNKGVVQKNNNNKHSILSTWWLNTVTTKQRMLLINPTLANTSYVNSLKLPKINAKIKV